MNTRLLLNRVVGYIRVSTEDQAESGAGLEAQRIAIRAECERRGWELMDIVEDQAVSGGARFADRPGGGQVLEMLRTRKVDGVVVAKMDRVTRSVVDFGLLLERAQRERWALVMLDLDLDTSTPTGEFTANIRASVAQFERRLIGQRTREALAALKAQGVILGRPPETAPDIEAYVVGLRRSGATLRAIAAQLATEGVPCAQGGSWHVSTVRRILGRHVSELPTFRRGPRPSARTT